MMNKALISHLLRIRLTRNDAVYLLQYAGEVLTLKPKVYSFNARRSSVLLGKLLVAIFRACDKEKRCISRTSHLKLLTGVARALKQSKAN